MKRCEVFDAVKGGGSMLEVGMRVRILLPFADGVYREGVIVEYCADCEWLWHVLPDGWEEGVDYAEEELAPVRPEPVETSVLWGELWG
jgi:hypothetical protein